MQLQQLLTLLSNPATYVAVGVLAVAVGLVGSALEKLGLVLGVPRLEALGKLLESVAADVPKALGNLQTVAKGLKPPAATLMLCLMLALPVAIFCSACGLFGSGGALAPVADCAPPVPELLSQVTAVLESPTSDWEAELERLAEKDGLRVVECAAQAYLSKAASSGAARPAAQGQGEARGKAWLAKKQATGK